MILGIISLAILVTCGSSTCAGGDGYWDSMCLAMVSESIRELPAGKVAAGMVYAAKPSGPLGGTRGLRTGSTSGYSVH